MQSFRTELENPLVEKDIIELEQKIRLFRNGELNEEKFRSLRLARGVYGQRQQGVQMVRIKLPYGKLSFKQLLKIADISEEYSNGNLHLTTRQDIQIHHVSLDKTPELWYKLEQENITLREACGNTVRNITASSNAGIDPDEPFDITPYAHALYEYFLRNPVCQEMGRKIKIAFSSSDKDSALTYMHDIGFIPKIRMENGNEVRGFKVLIGGGLGAQPFLAQVAHEFLHEDLIVPYTEGVLRVFDRHGERHSRHKARIKYLVNKIGLEEFSTLVNEEQKALKVTAYKIDSNVSFNGDVPGLSNVPFYEISDREKYKAWMDTNVVEQNQKGFFGVYLKVQTGDLSIEKARKLVKVIEDYVADDLRVTINQGLLLKFVRKEYLEYLFAELDKLGLAEPGFDSTSDITACPGTDTCNLGISSSTGVTRALEKIIKEEFPDLIYNNRLKIKISGCMNSCGQHAIANIGFHGSSIKNGANVLPALQVLLGGGTLGNGEGRIAEKVIKIPSKRGPHVLRTLFNDYENNAGDGEYFNDYYDRKGKDYFYQLLKPIADLTSLVNTDYIDWGQEEKFQTAIGVGECAGVMIDLVSTLLFESEEKIEWALESFKAGAYSDAIYHSYASLISTAKSLLLASEVHCNRHHGIINDFDKHFDGSELLVGFENFKTLVLQINQNEPSCDFAEKYMEEAKGFLEKAKERPHPRPLSQGEGSTKNN